jgi:hypothetical protein
VSLPYLAAISTFKHIEASTPTATLDTDAATKAVDFRVANISLADFGRKEIDIAEQEMPGLMASRNKYAQQARRWPAYE